MGFMRPALLALCMTGWVGVAAAQVPRAAALTSTTPGGPFCAGEYAEDLAAMSTHARGMESASAPYSYAVRTTATYECVSYNSDGDLKRTRWNTRAHGTAFGYRQDGGDTLLLTNHHVAEWPAVTDDDHPVDGVPGGCKRVADALKIVDDDHDDYAADDIPLTRVVSDARLDVAILRARKKLTVIPWKVGKSAALAARTAVEVKGFPLGQFHATNVGKVVSTYDHDVSGERDHDDFVVDALLTSGGSGSPVFAVSCRTGELELVGIFHARYAGASALNVVVAIDQVRPMMATLKRTPRVKDRSLELDASARARLVSAVMRDPDPAFFSLGASIASVAVRGDGSLVFAVFPSDFPRTTRPVLAIEDVAEPDPASFGTLGSTYFGSPTGLVRYAPGATELELQAQLARLLTALRTNALATFDYREALRSGTHITSRAAYDQLAGKKRVLERLLATQKEATQATLELASRTSVPPGNAIALREIETASTTTALVNANADDDSDEVGELGSH